MSAFEGKADIAVRLLLIRKRTNSRRLDLSLCAKSGHPHCSKRFCYSITSSAPNRNLRDRQAERLAMVGFGPFLPAP